MSERRLDNAPTAPGTLTSPGTRTDRERMLASFQRIGEAVLSSLDQEDILDVLAQEIVG